MHGALRAWARMGRSKECDRASRAASGRCAVVQSVEVSHCPVSWGIKKKEREMPLSMGSRGGRGSFGQHSSPHVLGFWGRCRGLRKCTVARWLCPWCGVCMKYRNGVHGGHIEPVAHVSSLGNVRACNGTRASVCVLGR